jgi:hypothetical protein
LGGLFAHEIRFLWIDKEAALHRSAPEQHPELHTVPISQGDLDLPPYSANHDFSRDNVPVFAMATRICHDSPVE